MTEERDVRPMQARVSADQNVVKVASVGPKHGFHTVHPHMPSAKTPALFYTGGRLRQVGLFAIAAMGIWPLLLQLILVPESVFGDGHGDRYEEVSYFAMENDHYQVLSPRKVDCGDLQSVLFGGVTPSAVSKDLVRAVSESTFKTTRAMVVNQTTGASAARLNVDTGVLSLAKDKSVCFGGVDDEGSVQIEALLTASDTASFGLDASCLEGEATHMRLRVQSTEFFQADTMGELNPGRKSGAMVIVSLVDTDLRPVLSSCYEATRVARFKATQNESEYKRVVSVYSKHLLVPETCDELTLFGGSRDEFGCAYSALGTSGAVADLGVANAYSYPAPWRMIQCTVAGECSSLLFTQLWLSEWTVENAKASDGTSGGGAGRVLRHNFVNHKVNEVTVDSTFSLRVLISVQILALVVTAYLTSVRGWHEIHCSVVSPWASVANATTSCTVAKVVRSSYNFILVAQMVLGMFQWRKQLTIDMLVGANTTQAVLRATGCGTLVVVLAINIVFARAGDLKMQEMEPSFAHVVGFVASVVLYSCTHVASVGASARALLIKGMHTVAANEVTQYSGCRGSFVCAAQVSLRDYCLVVFVILLAACCVGLMVQGALQASVRGARRSQKTSPTKAQSVRSSSLTEWVNSFTRFLDDRSRSTNLYDCSTEVYIQTPTGLVLSTRGQLEACGFVPATTVLFRYRDLPLFLVARVVPLQLLNFFNLTVTIYEVVPTSMTLNGLPVVHVSDQIIHAHWTKLKRAKLSWDLALFGGDDQGSRFSSVSQQTPVQPQY